MNGGNTESAGSAVSGRLSRTMGDLQKSTKTDKLNLGSHQMGFVALLVLGAGSPRAAIVSGGCPAARCARGIENMRDDE